MFACKVNDEEDYNYSLENGSSNTPELTQVRRVIELDSELFAQFKADTMGYFDYMESFGGSSCLIDLDKKYPQYKGQWEGMGFVQILNKDKEVKADWDKHSVEIGTMIVDRNDKSDFLIASQQGYNYARYIAFPSHITQTPTPATLTK